jgi:signal transduction histidine kinase
MHEAQKCFCQLGDSLPHLVWTVNAEERLSYGNYMWRARTAITVGEPVCGSFMQALHPDDRQAWHEVWQSARESGNGYQLTSRVRFKADGEYSAHLENGQPICDDSGRIVEWLMMATAPGDEQRLIAGLQRSLQRGDQLLFSVAHEMRNPLAPIAHALEVLDHGSSDSMAVNARALIRRQLSQLGRQVDDLLDLARLEHGQMKLRTNSVDLDAVLFAAVEVAQPLINARHHELITTGSPDAAIVLGDEGRLTQVFANLLINAAKYTERAGRIWVSVEHEAPWVIVRIRDSGVGISQDMLPKIFDVYVRAGRERAGTGGLGLGLTLARDFVELHGGTLQAHSEGAGKGSEFVVRLPAAEERGRGIQISSRTGSGRASERYQAQDQL